MTDKKHILDYWPVPEFTPRDNQIKALNWIENEDAKYLILESPVGSGKSLIGLTASRYMKNLLGSSFILTPQIILQNQYENDFDFLGRKSLASLYGKSNYKCVSKKTSCAIGTIVKPRCDHCPFLIAKNYARQSANTVLNYKLALTSFEYAETFEKRNLMIMDEAHTLERHLVDFDLVEIAYYRCKKYNIKFKQHTDINAAIIWVKETYLPKIQDEFSDMEEEYEYLQEKMGSEITKQELNKLREIDELGSHMNDVLQMSIRTKEYLNENFILTWDKTMFSFKRISGSYAFNKIIKPKANRFLFMSSTILNKTAFCNDLGIDPKEAAFLSLDSEFDIAKRPVYYMPVMKMNVSWNKPENTSLRKKMIKRIIGLLDIHKNDSGLLHTANFQIAKWLIDELKDNIDHVIYQHNPEIGDNRKSAINGFLDSNKPSILISPSSTEGLDLKDDLARFAIIIKTPFGYLGDQWIKRRMEMSNEWYRRMAMINVIQGGGRIVRSNTDNGTVYILDESFGYLYSKSAGMVPKWWKNSFTAL